MDYEDGVHLMPRKVRGKIKGKKAHQVRLRKEVLDGWGHDANGNRIRLDTAGSNMARDMKAGYKL